MLYQRDQTIRQRFRGLGYTLTSQRRVVLETLEDLGGHPTAEDVYLGVKEREPRISLGTVYRTLSVLEEIGVAVCKRWPDSPARYDLNTEPHLDILCVRCGEVAEAPGVETGDLEREIQSNTAYELTRTAVAVEGVCPRCRGENGSL